MPRREHSPYQLAFDFHASSEPSPLPCQAYSVDLAGLGAREEHLGRFVRVVNDEIIVRAPVDAAQYLLQHVYVPFEAFDQEELYVLTLNTKNRITHETMVYRGTVNSIHIRPAELFTTAVRVNAPAILMAHQHPSGDCSPSQVIWRKSQVSNMAASAGFSTEIPERPVTFDAVCVAESHALLPRWTSFRLDRV